MPATSTTKTWDSVVTSTLEKYFRAEAYDQLMVQRPLLAWQAGLDLPAFEEYSRPSDIPPELVAEESGIKELDGGANIVVPLRYKRDDNTAWIGPYDQLSTAVANPFTSAIFDWKIIGCTVTVSDIILGRNQGESQVFDYLKGMIDSAMETMVDRFSTDLFLDGTGNNNQAILGLQAIVANDPTSGTLGGIDRSNANNAFWRNQYLDELGALDMNSVRRVFNNCSIGVQHPTILIMDQKTYEDFENDVTSNRERVVQNKRLAQIGFQHFSWRGMAVVCWDPACPEGTIYFLNRQCLKLAVNRNTRFKESGWIRVPGRATKTNSYFMECELIPTEPRRLGVLFNITVT